MSSGEANPMKTEQEIKKAVDEMKEEDPEVKCPVDSDNEAHVEQNLLSFKISDGSPDDDKSSTQVYEKEGSLTLEGTPTTLEQIDAIIGTKKLAEIKDFYACCVTEKDGREVKLKTINNEKCTNGGCSFRLSGERCDCTLTSVVFAEVCKACLPDYETDTVDDISAKEERGQASSGITVGFTNRMAGDMWEKPISDPHIHGENADKHLKYIVLYQGTEVLVMRKYFLSKLKALNKRQLEEVQQNDQDDQCDKGDQAEENRESENEEEEEAREVGLEQPTGQHAGEPEPQVEEIQHIDVSLTVSRINESNSVLEEFLSLDEIKNTLPNSTLPQIIDLCAGYIWATRNGKKEKVYTRKSIEVCTDKNCGFRFSRERCDCKMSNILYAEVCTECLPEYAKVTVNQIRTMVRTAKNDEKPASSGITLGFTEKSAGNAWKIPLSKPHRHGMPLGEHLKWIALYKGHEGASILLFLPNVIQLPISILAAARIGSEAVVVSAVDCSVDKLSEILEMTTPKLIVTLDAFFQGTELIESKKVLDEASDKQDPSVAPTVLVIRHCSPNEGVPPPEVVLPARRPNCAISVFRTASAENTEIEWMNPHETFAILPISSPNLYLRSISIKEFLDATEALSSSLSASSGPILSLPVPGSLFSLAAMMCPWFAGKCLALYEGQLDYPDSARLNHIIAKFEIETVILEDSASLDVEYLGFVPVPSLKTLITSDKTDSNKLALAYPGNRIVDIKL